MRVVPTKPRRLQTGSPGIAVFPAASFIVPAREERRATVAEQLRPTLERAPAFKRTIRERIRRVLRTLAGLRRLSAAVLIYRAYGEL